MIRLVVGASSEVGQVRSANEDSFLVADGLVAVADGMGGHRAGDVASSDTVEVLGAIEGSRALDELVRAVHQANRQVSERSEDDPDLHGMGTTVCVAGLVRRDDKDEVAILNVGDSRIYLYSGGELGQLTEDHSLVETLVQEGRITAEEARDHPQKNVLTRALGVEPLVVVDAWLLDPRDGDRLLLCSDGLTNELDDDSIAEILGAGDNPETTSRRLVASADASGGRDNITAVVADVEGSGHPASAVEGRFRRITTPAVDLSDEHGPLTETVMAVVTTGAASALSDDEDESESIDPDDEDEDGGDSDNAETATSEDSSKGPTFSDGDTSGVVDGDPEIAELASGVGASDAATETARANRWRTLAFVLAILSVIALAVGAIAFTARQGWYVSEDDQGFAALYHGTPVLWIQPAEVDQTPLLVADLTPSDQADVREGRTFSTEAEARRLLDNLSTTTTSTSTTSTTTTTRPPTTRPPTTRAATTAPPAAPPGP